MCTNYIPFLLFQLLSSIWPTFCVQLSVVNGIVAYGVECTLLVNALGSQFYKSYWMANI